MIGRAEIAGLIPHGGAMVLLDAVAWWHADAIACTSRRHLDADNPLRRDGRLPPVAGIEFALQAAALHGALTEGRPQKPGFLAVLRDVSLSCDRLDDDAFAVLSVGAVLQRRESGGLIYSFDVSSGRPLLSGSAVIAL